MSKSHVNVSITVATPSVDYPNTEISLISEACSVVYQRLPISVRQTVDAFRVRPYRIAGTFGWCIETVLVIPGSEIRQLTAVTRVVSGDSPQTGGYEFLVNKIVRAVRKEISSDKEKLSSDIAKREQMIAEMK